MRVNESRLQLACVCRPSLVSSCPSQERRLGTHRPHRCRDCWGGRGSSLHGSLWATTHIYNIRMCDMKRFPHAFFHCSNRAQFAHEIPRWILFRKQAFAGAHLKASATACCKIAATNASRAAAGSAHKPHIGRAGMGLDNSRTSSMGWVSLPISVMRHGLGIGLGEPKRTRPRMQPNLCATSASVHSASPCAAIKPAKVFGKPKEVSAFLAFVKYTAYQPAGITFGRFSTSLTPAKIACARDGLGKLMHFRPGSKPQWL